MFSTRQSIFQNFLNRCQIKSSGTRSLKSHIASSYLFYPTKMPPSQLWFVAANATQEALAPIDIGWQVLGPATTICSLAFLVVLARWYTRIFIVRTAGLEDVLISLAMVCPVKTFAWCRGTHRESYS